MDRQEESAEGERTLSQHAEHLPDTRKSLQTNQALVGERTN